MVQVHRRRILEFPCLYHICLQNVDGHYISKVKDMIKEGSLRLIVNINDLRAANFERCNG
jgi:hypothetical protein